MKATEFETNHRTLIRHLLIAAAFSTYLFDRDDVIWRFIKNSPARTELEHALFFAAAVLIGCGAWLCTRRRASLGIPDPATPSANADRSGFIPSRHAGELLYAIGLASLFPLWGSVILIAGEAVRLVRLIGREQTGRASRFTRELSISGLRSESTTLAALSPHTQPHWARAIRHEAAKWGLFLTMMVFSITLVDRVAEVLTGASLLAWVVLNLPSCWHRTPASTTP
jgi:hypothetical protein